MTESKHPWNAALPMLYQRAATDAEFRALCKQDARAAIQQLGDFDMPAEVKVRFVEHVDELVFPLPALVPQSGELALDELDAVAGGAVNVGGGYTGASTVYSGYGYGGYGTPSVWPPVDPNTASGLPPLIAPGGGPPGY